MGKRSDKTLSQRIWDRIGKAEPNACWPWLKHCTPGGYGLFVHQVDGKSVGVYAHRFTYEETKGSIPSGWTIDHLCRNPPCANPAHLEAVPHRTNLLRGRGFVAQQAAKTHCAKGHELAGENLYLWRGHRDCRKCRNERASAYYKNRGASTR